MQTLRGILIVLLASASLVRADWKEDAKRCSSEPNRDAAIRYCTAAINSGKLSTENLAIMYYNRGIRYQDQVEYDRAIQDYTEAVRLSTNYAKAFHNRGTAYSLKGEYDQAIQDYNEAIRLDSSFADAFNNRGNAYLHKGDYDRAIQDYTEALRLKPGLAEPFNNRGFAYLSKGDYDHVIQDCNEASRLKPDFVQAFRNRGEAYRLKGEYDRAVQDFSEALRLKPNHMDALHKRGLTYSDKGDYDHALQDFDQAIRLNAKDDEAFLERGRAHAGKGEFDLAIQDYDAALRLKPDKVDAFLNRGVAYDNKGVYDRAIQDYDQAQRIAPNDARPLHYRGVTYSNKGQYDRAIQDLSEAIRLDANDEMAFNARGAAYNQKGNYDAAILDLDQALRLNPSFSEALSNRGFAWFHKGDFDRAAKDFDEAIHMDLSNAEAFKRRGFLLARKGSHQLAKYDFDQAIRLKPDDGIAIFNRGLEEFNLGDFAAAHQDFAALNPAPYPALWLYLSQARTGQAGRAELAGKAATIDLKVWPGPVINLYLGRATAVSVLAAAKSTNPSKDREQHCEAFFYLGQQALIDGRQSEANRLFQRTLETGIISFVEYTAAKAELQRFAQESARRCRDDHKKDAGAAAVLRDCSDAIASGQLSGMELASIYTYRGEYFQSKREYDRAIQDYSQAVSLRTSQAKEPPVDPLAAALGELLSTDPMDLVLRSSSSDAFANAFALRGSAYEAKGEVDRAIPDYDQAIQIDKNFFKAFVWRGRAYASKDNCDRAIQDYDQAIRLNPALAKLWFLYQERGGLYFYLGQFAAAEKDFATSLDPIAVPNSAIWRYLARARAGQEARTQLEKDTAKMDLKAWPGPVISFYLGKATAESVLAAAKDPDPAKDRQQQGEAHFYLGQQALIAGNRAEAQRLFRLSLETRGRTSLVAQAELKRLQPRP